jgi:hypothetical protein
VVDQKAAKTSISDHIHLFVFMLFQVGCQVFQQISNKKPRKSAIWRSKTTTIRLKRKPPKTQPQALNGPTNYQPNNVTNPLKPHPPTTKTPPTFINITIFRYLYYSQYSALKLLRNSNKYSSFFLFSDIETEKVLSNKKSSVWMKLKGKLLAASRLVETIPKKKSSLTKLKLHERVLCVFGS